MINSLESSAQLLNLIMIKILEMLFSAEASLTGSLESSAQLLNLTVVKICSGQMWPTIAEAARADRIECCSGNQAAGASVQGFFYSFILSHSFRGRFIHFIHIYR